MSRSVVHPLGMVWYDEADYADARRVMRDGDSLPNAYGDWLARAVQAEGAVLALGVPVIRAPIRSGPFLAWCVTHRAEPDRRGRSRYAFDHAHDRFIDELRGGHPRG